MEIPRGRGDLKAKLLEGQYEAKLEFPGGCGGAKQINLPWGEYGYFLELHILVTCMFDQAWILQGEIRCLSLLGLKELKKVHGPLQYISSLFYFAQYS